MFLTTVCLQFKAYFILKQFETYGCIFCLSTTSLWKYIWVFTKLELKIVKYGGENLNAKISKSAKNPAFTLRGNDVLLQAV